MRQTIKCIKCGSEAVFQSIAIEPHICITCQRMSQSTTPISDAAIGANLEAYQTIPVAQFFGKLARKLERDLQAAREQVKKEHDEVIRWMVQSSEWCEKHKADLQAAQARIGELEKMLNWFRGRSVDEVVSVISDDGDGATLEEAIQTAIQNSNKGK